MINKLSIAIYVDFAFKRRDIATEVYDLVYLFQRFDIIWGDWTLFITTPYTIEDQNLIF